MFCKNCGREINDNAMVCPYCGVATGKGGAVAEEKKVNAFGIVGFVLGLLSLWLGVYFCISPVLGLIFSAVGMAKMKKCRVNGLAIAGLVLSIISLFVWGIVWIVVGAAILG
ncbi:MAG: zinc ribbon domain-containing protein [Clostridia bacterium]|nr:zinc ribbon domain-containing protein [Clostridia bacterium]